MKVVFMQEDDRTLADVCTEVHDLGEIFSKITSPPKKGERCWHIAMTGLFIKTENGCIMRCASCKKLFIKFCPCGIGSVVKVLENGQPTGELMTVLPCDANEGMMKGLFMKR